MPYMSKITIMGHLGKDPEIKTYKDDKAVVTFTVAVNIGYGDNKVANWFDVAVFKKLPDWKMNDLKKGAIVVVTGDFKHTVTESHDRYYNHLNVTADSVEIIPRAKGQQAASASASETEPQWSQMDIPF